MKDELEYVTGILTYTSVASKEELNTKEAERAVKVAEQKAVRLQVNQAVMRGQVLPIHQEMTHVWMMDCYTRTVRMQKVFLNN